VAARCASLLVRLISVPLALSILGTEGYGVWLTLGSILMWLSLADLGLPTGMLNPLASALAAGDNRRARHLVSSTYFVLGAASGLIMLVGAWVVWNLPLADLLRVSAAYDDQLKTAALVALCLSAVLVPTRVCPVVLRACQRGHLSSISDILGQLASLAALALLAVYGGNLTSFVLASLGAPALVALAQSLWLFKWYLPHLSPHPKWVSLSSGITVGGQGSLFFIATIGEIVIMQTDFLVITHALGPAEVPKYAVTYQLFMSCYLLVAYWAHPLWPAYADAAARGEMDWVRRVYRRNTLQSIIAITVVVTVLAFAAPVVVRIWAGAETMPPAGLPWIMAVYFISWTWSNSNAMLINALGGVRGRALGTIANAVVNIIVSLALVKPLGIIGVALGSLAGSLLTEAIFFPILVRRLLKEQAVANG